MNPIFSGWKLSPIGYRVWIVGGFLMVCLETSHIIGIGVITRVVITSLVITQPSNNVDQLHKIQLWGWAFQTGPKYILCQPVSVSVCVTLCHLFSDYFLISNLYNTVPSFHYFLIIDLCSIVPSFWWWLLSHNWFA